MDTGNPFTIKESAIIQGKPTIYLSQTVPLRNQQNEIIGILGISIDITEQEELHQQLSKAKEKAEAASKAKDEFIRNIRTPLSGIIGMSNLLEQDAHTSEERENAHMLNGLSFISMTHSRPYLLQTNQPNKLTKIRNLWYYIRHKNS